MKKMKKIFAVLLTLAMVLGMSMTTMAAANSHITISGTGIDENAEVKYGQIIKEDRKSPLGWQFVSNEVATLFVEGWNSVDESNLNANQVIAAMIAADMLENPANANVETGTITSSANLSAALDKVTGYADKTMDITTGADVSETGKGLYIVTAKNEGFTFLPMAAYMNTAGDDVAVVAKGAENYITKTVDGESTSVNPGDEITYTVETPYIFLQPDAETVFTVTDTLTNATFKADSLIIKLKGKTEVLIKDVDYTVNNYGNTQSMTINFGEKYKAKYAGEILTITYKAIAGDNITSENGVQNRVGTTNAQGKIVETKPVNFKVIKKNEEGTLTLSGAKFQLYKDVPKGTAGAVELKVGTETKYGLPYGDEVETDNNGEAAWDNLDAQDTYYVKETLAPNGYTLNETVFVLSGTIQNTDQVEPTKIDGVEYIKTTHSWTDFNDQIVKDTKLASLPSTGGIGTTIFTIGGCIIMIVAAALFFASRKKSNN